jgi:hypothetical protein
MEHIEQFCEFLSPGEPQNNMQTLVRDQLRWTRPYVGLATGSNDPLGLTCQYCMG